MVACPRCHFMNPVKQKACQACGTTLPYASSPSHSRPGTARPTLRGMRSPDTPSEGSVAVTPAKVDGLPGLATSDQTMPSMVGPTPEQIKSHRANNTLLGHVSPAAVGQAPPASDSAPSSKAPMSPPVVSSGTASVQLRPVVAPASLQARGGISRQPTLVGHAPVRETKANVGETRVGVSQSSTSQTLPSMQAVRGDEMTAPASSSDEADGEPPAAAPLIEPPAPVPKNRQLEETRVPAQDNPAKTYLAVTAVSLAPSPVPSDLLEPQRTSEAPSYPGMGTPPPLPTRTSAPAEAPIVPVSRSMTSLAAPAISSAQRLSRRAVQSRLGRAVLGLAALLGVGLGVFTWKWQPETPITGRINANTATPTLEVECQSCADGSFVELDQRRGTFQRERATIVLDDTPKVGANAFELHVHRTGMGRDEQVELAVEVDYRARWDLSGLATKPPRVNVNVEAAPGVSVKVDTAEVDLVEGRGTRALAIAYPVGSMNASVEWLEQAVVITTQKAGAAPISSPFQIRLPVVPLTIDTPWNTFQTEAKSVVLSGRTAPKARVLGPEGEAQADEAGYFELTVTPQLGLNNVELTASAEHHAPRSASCSFTQVDNLTPVAVAYQTDAIRRFDQLTAEATNAGAPVRVALSGKVQDWKTSHNLTIILLTITSGCPSRSCLVRVQYPGVLELSINQAISVFGEARPAPPDVGPLPQIHSHFILH